NFPIQALDSAAVLQDRLAILYLYSADAAAAIEIWRGYTGAPSYNGEAKTVDIPLTFLFDSLNIPLPTVTLPEAGVGTVASTTNTASNAPDTTVPLFYGAGQKGFRSITYRSEVIGQLLYVNFIVSGTAPGHPIPSTGGAGAFATGDLIDARLFGTIEP